MPQIRHRKYFGSKEDSANFHRRISLSWNDSSSLIRSLKSSTSNYSGLCSQVRLEVSSSHSLLIDCNNNGSVNSFFTGARFSAIDFPSVGGFLPFFSVTKQNLVGTYLFLNSLRVLPGRLIKHDDSKYSPQSLEGSFTDVFVLRIFAIHLDRSSLSSKSRRCHDVLFLSDELLQPYAIHH